MSEKTITLIVARHGKAQHNLGSEKEHRFAGNRVDTSLALEGIDDAKLLAHKIQKMGGCDLIISSTLKRSRETAEIIAKKLGMKATSSISELSEINIGDFAGHTEDEVKKLFPEEAKTFYDGDVINWHFPNGEDYNQVTKRLAIALQKIKKIANPRQRVLVVGHGMINCILFHQFLPDRIDLWQERSYPHDRLVEIKYKWEGK